MKVYHVTGTVRREDGTEQVDLYVVDEDGIEAARQVIKNLGITQHNVKGSMRSQAVGKNAAGPARVLEGAEDNAWRNRRQSA